MAPEVLCTLPESFFLDITSSDEFLLSLTVRHPLAELLSIHFSFIGLLIVWGSEEEEVEGVDRLSLPWLGV